LSHFFKKTLKDRRAVVLALFIISPFTLQEAAASGKALIYSGVGACKDGCVEAAAQVAIRAGLEVEYVKAAQIRPEIFKDAAVWIQPGGDAIQLSGAISATKKALISDFISRGGKYLGFCAGAFFADQKVDDANTVPGLGILPGVTQDYTKEKAPMILPMIWKGQLRYVYFEEGAAIYPNNQGSHVNVVAVYENFIPAVVTFKHGLGKAALSGVHPEAPSDWKAADQLNDPDGSDFDLSDDLMHQLLN